MAPAVLSAPRMIVRTLQAVCGLVAMIFTSLGYIKSTLGQLSSASAIYSTIACYSALVCGLYCVVALRVLKLMATAPKVLYQRGANTLLFVALLVAGIVHAALEAVKDCASYTTTFESYHGSTLFRCGSMNLGYVLSFIATALPSLANSCAVVPSEVVEARSHTMDDFQLSGHHTRPPRHKPMHFCWRWKKRWVVPKTTQLR